MTGQPAFPNEEQPRVGGVLLAAGRSRRFGEENKLLAEIGDDPVVSHAAETLVASTVRGVVVVLGHEVDRVSAALDTLPLELRTNDDYADGQSTSVAAGVAAARERGWDAVVFALGDMPFVDVATIDSLVATYANDADSIVAPAHQGRRGNPVLFDQRHYDALATLQGDVGGRDLVEAEGTVIPVDDPGIHRDIDDPADLAQRDDSDRPGG